MKQSAPRIFRNVLDFRSDSSYLHQKIYNHSNITLDHLPHICFFNNYCIYLSYTYLYIHDIGYGTCPSLFHSTIFLSIFPRGMFVFNGERGTEKLARKVTKSSYFLTEPEQLWCTLKFSSRPSALADCVGNQSCIRFYLLPSIFIDWFSFT